VQEIIDRAVNIADFHAGPAASIALTQRRFPRGSTSSIRSTPGPDRGVAPGGLVQVTQEKRPPFAVTASRPMCRYPQWPRYMGASPKEAASFSCVSEND
jgi:hypothetical protein